MPRPAARQETLEEKLGEVIEGINIDEGLLDWLIQALRESHRDEKAYHDGMIASLQAQYDKLQHRIDQAYTDKLDGKIPEELFLRKMNEWREEQSKILSQIRAQQTANHNYLEEGICILELANKAYSLYLIPFRYEHTALTACTTYGYEVSDRIAVLAYGVRIISTRCSHSSIAAVTTQANCAFTSCHRRSMGLSSGL
jgi:hypothetical protein